MLVLVTGDIVVFKFNTIIKFWGQYCILFAFFFVNKKLKFIFDT